MESGVLFIATGEKYREEAKSSARRVKQLHDYPITLVSDEQSNSDLFDSEVLISEAYNDFRDKVENIYEQAYPKTLYLDSDTYICDREALPSIFQLLDDFDLAAAHDPGRRIEVVSYPEGHPISESGIPEINAPPAFPEYNTGVIGFKTNDRINSVMDDWRSIYSIHHANYPVPGVNDQPAFRESLFANSVRLATLPPEYNYRTNVPQYRKEKVKILHGRIGCDQSWDDLQKVVNAEPDGKRQTFHSVPRERGDWLFPVNVPRLKYNIKKIKWFVERKFSL